MMNTKKLLLHSKIPIRLACITSSNWPVTISLWFIFIDNKFFCATKRSAKIVEYLKKYPKCGFEIAGDYPPYAGIRGWGVVDLDESKGKKILKKLIRKIFR